MFASATATKLSDQPVETQTGYVLAINMNLLPESLRKVAGQRLAEASKKLPDEPLIISLQGLLHARRSQPELAQQCVQRALDSGRSFGHTHHTYYQIACVYAVLRETQKAMEWLERSVHTGFSCWPFFRIDPNLENLREEPEFKQLIADLEHKHTLAKVQRL